MAKWSMFLSLCEKTDKALQLHTCTAVSDYGSSDFMESITKSLILSVQWWTIRVLSG